MSTVSLFDARPFFEKALAHGVQHGIIPPEKIEAMNADAPKGMVQIARYFGSEFLRPELEKAKDRMVNLISLYLEHSTGGDLQLAAESLRDHSFLSRSKGGSDMLKSLIAMPQNSHFGMNEYGGFTNDHIPQLAKWSLRPLTDYQLELAQRTHVAQELEAATWLADTLGLDASDLQEAGKDAEAVIRTALLLGTLKLTKMPDWVAFDQLVSALRQKYAPQQTTTATAAKGKATRATSAATSRQTTLTATADTALVASKASKSAAGGSKAGTAGMGMAAATPVALTIAMPKKLPERFKPVVEAMRQSVLSDLPKILDTSVPTRKLFCQTPAFIGRYFWMEDMVSEIDHFDRTTSAAWARATAGHQDDASLLTLFLCVAAGSTPKTLLTERAAAALCRKIRKSGLKPELATQYIRDHAPELHQSDYLSLWTHFTEEALTTLTSDLINAQKDALALLRRECHVAG